jgi:hypothetical protein
MAELVNKLSYEALCKMTDTNKQKYGQFLDVIRMCNNFKCDECEQSFGDITTWGTDRAVVLDSLTGISKMAMRLVVGGKVAKAPPDYGVAQETLMKLLDAWTTQCHCWFTITAHQSMEKDESTGMIKRMPNTVGRAISPEIPNFFSDVLESIRIGSEFYWDTASVGADVKARNVPIGSKLTPSFVPLVKRWKEKGGIIENVEG